jgi:aryl-alcohol dehydrogenase-like predicted oxidoreductase
MQTRKFGKTDMETTPIGFGSWAVGGSGWAAGWGPQDDEESVGAIRRALELGVNWIDTAAVYGLGHSEEIVARALEGVSERPYVFTKCSMVWDENGEIGHSIKAESVKRECENSLRRLRTDAIDLYQIHWPNPDEEIEEGWSAMAELKAEGKVRHIGVSNFDVGQMKRAQEIASVESLQPPYSMLSREIEDEILPYCQENGIAVIVYSPMKSGLLTGKMTRERAQNLPEDDWRSRASAFQEPQLSRTLELVELLGEIGDRHGVSSAEVAIAWTLSHPAVTGAIVGARRPDQVDGVVGAADLKLTGDELDEIGAFLKQNP